MNYTNFSSEIDKLKQKLVSAGLDSVWLFGYGSLLWKVDFEYSQKLHGYLRNYKRQFFLLSDDHRGTPENPGRVVTLVKSEKEDDTSKVYGIAYEIKIENMEKTFDHLNVREKCGYSLNEVNFQIIDSDQHKKAFLCVCYFAVETNTYFSPENDTHKIAEQIYKTVGPSGENKIYLYNLCDSLRNIAKIFQTEDILENDEHIFYLESLVKKYDFTL